jgi:hypothetical protein
LKAIESLEPDMRCNMVATTGIDLSRSDSMLGGAVETKHVNKDLLNSDCARYSLASVQVSSGLTIGNGITIGRLYFYNVDGNRTTHIDLETVAVPDGIEVEYTTGSHWELTPADVHSEPVETVPEGMVNLALPAKLGAGITGYCLAHVVAIDILVDEAAALVDGACLEILATASWPGQTGQVLVQQTRTFSFYLDME